MLRIASFVALVLAVGGFAGFLYCQDGPKDAPKPAGKEASKDAPKEGPKRIKAGKDVELEIDGDARRVIVKTKVCLRQGPLEQLLTCNRLKEHEAILDGEFDARDIHKAQVCAGAEPGSPVQCAPKYKPASGTSIKVMVEYQDGGKTVRKRAQEWIRDSKTKKPLAADWVFAGSQLKAFDPKEPPNYLANGGNVICISNFDDAMLDLPIDSTKENDSLFYEANTDAIPANGTVVTLILEPIPATKKK